VTHVGGGGLGDEVQDSLWRSTKTIYQWGLALGVVLPWVHHLNKLLSCRLQLLQLFLAFLLLFAQSLDLLEAVDELLLRIGNHLLQPLDFICAAIEHVLQVSKQLFFIIYEFLNFCGDEQVLEYTIIANDTNLRVRSVIP
jgi:hypothetical protein